MALSCRTLVRNNKFVHFLTKPECWNLNRNYSLKVVSSGICYSNTLRINHATAIHHVKFISTGKFCAQDHKNALPETSQNEGNPGSEKPKPEEQKQSLIQRFKKMYKDYWYVLLPVHMCTSAVWFGGFYYAVRSGVDVIAILESIGLSDRILDPLKHSEAGYLAFAFALYKLSAPLRYAVTLGGTTFAIRKLQAIGWIKPVPSRERLKEMFQEQKDVLQDRFAESKQHCQTQIKKAKSSLFMEEMRKYQSEMKTMKNKSKQEKEK